MSELAKMERILSPELEEARDGYLKLLGELVEADQPELQRLYDRFKRARRDQAEEAWRSFTLFRDASIAARQPIIDELVKIESMASVRMTIPADSIDSATLARLSR